MPSRPAIVVGYDSEAASRAALATAVDLARRLGACLQVVHVVDEDDLPIDPDADDWDRQVDAALDVERAAVAAQLATSDVDWRYTLARGDPVRGLCTAADACRALMVVVGTRGEGWEARIDRVVHGSVSRRLIHHCHRPVLVVCHGRPTHG